MKNIEIKKYMSRLSNEELYEMAMEIMEWHETGFLKEKGKVRDLYKIIFDTSLVPLFAVQTVVEHEIVCRWTANYEK